MSTLSNPITDLKAVADDLGYPIAFGPEYVKNLVGDNSKIDEIILVEFIDDTLSVGTEGEFEYNSDMRFIIGYYCKSELDEPYDRRYSIYFETLRVRLINFLRSLNCTYDYKISSATITFQSNRYDLNLDGAVANVVLTYE